MKNQIKNMQLLKLTALVATGLFIASCSKDASTATGWGFNDPEKGGFEKVPFMDQVTGPGLTLVEGGSFTMGRSEQDVMDDWNSRSARVTVSSFYMDQTEVTNFNWLEYLYWISRAYESYPMVYKNALPDTLCWRSPLGFNEKYVEYYLRHPAYREYPVVGVSWLQANDFCKWRTDRVNEYILIKEGIFDWNTEQKDDKTFNTEAYLAGQYQEGIRNSLIDLNPSKKTDKNFGERLVRMEDGIFLPRYRLPTEAEWEFAAAGLIGNLEAGTENISERRIYPWNGHWVRNDDEKFQGQIRANFVRGKGDMMGVAGNLNDGGDITVPVDQYWPNDNGLYNMAGNVSEWVLDVYRPLTSEDYDEFRPYRGNVFKTKLLNNEGTTETKNAQIEYDVHGMKEYINEFERVRFQRITADEHKINDTVVKGLSSTVSSRNPVKRGVAPDRFYVSHNKTKDTVELTLLRKANEIIDKAIALKNDKFDQEASLLIQEELFEGLFTEPRTSTAGEEYAYEIVSMLKDGFNEYITDTPGKLKYRNVTEEENIGRLNYRKDDYADYLDGDIESSIYFKNDDRKNAINQASRDPKLVMYQSRNEEFGIDGKAIGENGNKAHPTTLISDKSHVYKGGSWKDRAYWLAVGNRRFLDEDQSTDAIGFRCAMDRVGSPTGLGNKKKKK